MENNDPISEHIFQDENLTDIEVALKYAQVFDSLFKFFGETTLEDVRKLYIRQAKAALRSMKNPYAKNYLMHKIDELNS
mgnify:CR=1 FL=1|jgi:hypothetical protein